MIADNEKTLPVLGERLKLILSDLQLKQTDFAKSLGISANYVYLLTSGKKKNISETLARLVESTYGYSATWLLTGNGNKYAAPQTTEPLKARTIRKVRNLPPKKLRAVAAFLSSLEDMQD